MAKRAAREAAEKPAQPQPQRRAAVKKTVKIGRPGYRVTKQFDPEQDQRSLLFQVSSCNGDGLTIAMPSVQACDGKDRECVALILLSKNLAPLAPGLKRYMRCMTWCKD